MTQSNNKKNLQGEALQQFLETAYEQIFSQEETDTEVTLSSEEREAALAELLSQQSFAPQDLQDLDQIHSAWSNAGRPDQALAFIEQHKQDVLARLPKDELIFANILCSLNSIHSLKDIDLLSAQESLQVLTPQLFELNSDELNAIFGFWLSLIESCQSYEMAEPHLEALYQLLFMAHRDNFFTHITYLLKKAAWANELNNLASAEQYVNEAIERFATLNYEGSYPDFQDWIYLAHQVLEHAPQSMTLLIETCNKQLAQTAQAPHQAIARYRSILVKRLLALAEAATGNLTKAVELGRESYYRLGLEDDEHPTGDLAFTALWMSWLEATEQFDELADIALDSSFNERGPALQAAYEMALRYVNEDSAQKEKWALVLAWPAMSEEAQQQVPPPPLPYTDYLDMIAPDSDYRPMANMMVGLILAQNKQDWKRALELLEIGVHHFPEKANSDVLSFLLAARFEIYGDEALQLPPPPCTTGAWCYNLGTLIGQDHRELFSEYMSDARKLPSKEALNALSQHYFEIGFNRFNHFWATGEGSFSDASLHTYAMMCNNYGILLNRFAGDHEYALQVFHKGFEASPFAELLNGILTSHIRLDNDEEIAYFAEELWLYANTYGYSRHDPRDYIEETSLALIELDRINEVAIWLERLEQWWKTAIEHELLDPEDPQERMWYYYAILPLLDKIGRVQPETALYLLREHTPGIRATQHSGLLRNLGSAFRFLESYEEAIPLLEEAISLFDDNTDEFDIEHGYKDLEYSKEALGLASSASEDKKPWWKVW